MTPSSLRGIVSAIYRPPFGKVWLSSVCWSPSAKSDNEVECRIYGGWVKTHFQFKAVLWTKVHVVLRRCRRLFATHLFGYVYRVPFRRHRPLKLPLNCDVVAKKVVFGPPICRGRETDFGDAFSNCTYFRPCGRFSLSSVQRVEE